MKHDAHRQRFRAIAASLSDTPSLAELEELATALAAAAVTASMPGKAAALLVRHALPDHNARVHAELRRLAKGVLADMSPPTPNVEPQAEWFPLDTAAAILGLPRRYILARLQYPEWRHSWGWPRWSGPRPSDWLFPRAAIEGATAAATLANTPSTEPPYPLPEWCVRADAPRD